MLKSTELPLTIGEDGWTSLICAASEGHTSVVELLLADSRVDKASIDHINEDGETALIWATREGHSSVVELLLADPRVDKASIDHANVHGRTVFIYAAENGHTSVVKLMTCDSRTSWSSTVELLQELDNNIPIDRKDVEFVLIAETLETDSDCALITYLFQSRLFDVNVLRSYHQRLCYINYNVVDNVRSSLCMGKNRVHEYKI
jgi:ankyrin repeat protein